MIKQLFPPSTSNPSIRALFILLFFGSIIEIQAQAINLLDNQYTPLTLDRFPNLDVRSSQSLDILLVDDFSLKSNLIDPDTTNNSTWNGLLGTAWLEVKDENATGGEEYPGGSFVGFVVENNGLLDLLSGITITTYLNDTPIESTSSSSLLSLGFPSGRARIGFYTTSGNNFDKIRLSASGLGDINVTVYKAEVGKFDLGEPSLEGYSLFSDTDLSTSPFKRNEKICFDISLGATGGILNWPPPQNSPFQVHVSTTNLTDRSIEFITDSDPYHDENFFMFHIPTSGQINFTQKKSIPEDHFSRFKVCGIIPSSTSDGSMVGYQTISNPGGYSSNNNGSNDPSNFGTVLGTLPIEIISFKAIPHQNVVGLKWETVSEDNNSHFEIERSHDSYKYERLGTVKGGGTTNQVIHYSYNDLRPFPGKNYYRLKQVDYNGTHTYSQVKQVDFYDKAGLKVFPNPIFAGEKIIIRGQKIRSVKLYDLHGQLIKEPSLQRPHSFVTLSTEYLPQGTYIIKVNGTSVKKVVVE